MRAPFARCVRIMDRVSWQALLTRWNAELLDTPDVLRNLVSPEVVESGWLGYPPATEEQIAAAESRIGKRLPPSYRAFLEVSNGWRLLGHFHWDVLPADRIEWFRVKNQDWIDAYQHPYASGSFPAVTDDEYFVYGNQQSDLAFRLEYLDALLEVSGVGDSVILLLNPEIVFPNGEWEAWDFGTWYPGAHRYRSFWDMMLHLHQAFLRLKNDPPARSSNDDSNG